MLRLGRYDVPVLVWPLCVWTGFYLLETGCHRIRAVVTVYTTQLLPKETIDWYYSFHRILPREADFCMHWREVLAWTLGGHTRGSF